MQRKAKSKTLPSGGLSGPQRIRRLSGSVGRHSKLVSSSAGKAAKTRADTHETLLLCEGYEDRGFSQHLLSASGIEKVRVYAVEGRAKFARTLKASSGRKLWKRLSAVILVADNDDDPEAR